MDHFESASQFFIEGLQLLEANHLSAAEAQFARSLELLPDRVSTLNNLAAVKLKLEKFAEAEALARRAIVLEIKSAEAWANLGLALTATGRHAEALTAYDRAIQGNPTFAWAWLNKATTLLELKQFAEALSACEQALKLNSSQPEIFYTRSLILKALGRADEARKTYRKSLEMRVATSPAFISERRAAQKAKVLIISHDPHLDDSLKPFEVLHLECPNFPGQIARSFQEDFHFTLVFESDAGRPFARTQISPPDFVINNNTNGEVIIADGRLPRFSELVDSFGVPVINHPAKAVQTTRDVSAQLLDGLPDIVVPKTRRFSAAGKSREDLVREIEGQYEYPLITRSLTLQQSIGMTKVDSRSALLAVLAADFPEKFYVTKFVDSRGGNQFFRKIRAAVVNGEFIIMRVDYDTDWKIYARKTDERAAFYLNNVHLLAEEKRICANPEAELGGSVIQSLRAICARIPLDAFGIDFDVDATGYLVFYEANATMNLLSTAHQKVSYPQAAEEALKLAFQRYFMSLVARR